MVFLLQTRIEGPPMRALDRDCFDYLVVFLAAGFLAVLFAFDVVVVFFAVEALAVVFLAVVAFAVVFFAVEAFAVVFLAVVAFAAGFFAVDFLAAGFLAVVFFGAAFFTGASSTGVDGRKESFHVSSTPSIWCRILAT